MNNNNANRTTKLHSELEQLNTLDRQKLADLWIKQYKHTPPKGAKRGLLERSEAYRLQAKQHGKLKPTLRTRLIAIANGASCNKGQLHHVSNLKLGIGTKLIREWHGKAHEVMIIDNGFVWNGVTHRSLSAIAFAITGAKWSGPRFFGIDK